MNLQTLIHSDEAPNTIIMMTGEDLRKLIDDTNAYTRQVIKEETSPSYYTTDDLMNLFKVSRTSIYNWVREGKLPEPFRPADSDKKLWSQAEIHKWVAAGRTGRYTHK